MPASEAQWKLASRIRRGVFSKDFTDYDYGRIAAYADQFSTLLGAKTTNMVEARQETQRLQSLIVKGDSTAISQYIVNIHSPTNTNSF
jgi:hypothetical protein